MADPGWGQGEQDDRWRNGPPSQPPPTVPFHAPPPPAAYPPPPAGYPPQPGYHQPVYLQPVMYAPMGPMGCGPPKSKVAAALLAFFLGTLGIHNFYLGRPGLGVAQLLLATVGGIFTCGISTVCVAVWAFVEFIVILCGGINDQYGRPLT